MRPSPFLNDPKDQVAEAVARAVASPMEEVSAIHLRAAEHWAALAKLNGGAVTPALGGKLPRG